MGTDDADRHPIAETWLGVLLLWGAFVVPSVVALLFGVVGIGSFPPVRDWVSSKVGNVPYALEVAVAVVYSFAILGSLGAVWWSGYQSTRLIGEATIVAILMLGIMGVIAVIGVYLGRGVRSLT